jgi:hypothetical protein
MAVLGGFCAGVAFMVVVDLIAGRPPRKIEAGDRGRR